jgi:hypothetical protein
MRCEHFGCKQTIVIQCFFPCEEFDENDKYYCLDHCVQHGYCQGCGVFCRGIESFDLSEDFCENCRFEGSDARLEDQYEGN